MLNNIQSYQIISCVGFSCFLGTLLAYIANTFYRGYPKLVNFDYAKTLDLLLSCVAMGILAGCMALAIGSSDFGYFESFSLANIFSYVFFMSLFIGTTDIWLGMTKKAIKLIFSKIIPANNNNHS